MERYGYRKLEIASIRNYRIATAHGTFEEEHRPRERKDDRFTK